MTRRLRLFLSCMLLCCAATSLVFAQRKATAPKLKAYFTVKPAQNIDSKALALSQTNALPLFVYNVTSSRDGNSYTGTMVGLNPFDAASGTANVTTQIVPLIIVTKKIGVKINKHGIIGTRNGTITFDPTVPDTTCLSAPNNVPLTLFQQSPILQPASFTFGGTSVGDTQYVDAFQRANFFSTIGADYHTLLSPVQVLDPITINVPEFNGLALPGALFGPGVCTLGIMDINHFDALLTSQIIPALAARGVNPSTFPMFLLYNVVMSFGTPTNLNRCCILGYHGANGLQTYSPMDFDMTGLFGPTVRDTSIAAHEVGEWMDDPFGNNPVPAWGHIGQQPGCQGNLEVGDPLSGTNIPDVTMPNGFSYHLQELVFFSWFYGAPSTAVNGWFSDNNTFTSDAGPPCQ